MMFTLGSSISNEVRFDLYEIKIMVYIFYLLTTLFPLFKLLSMLKNSYKNIGIADMYRVSDLFVTFFKNL